jgi:co-chaperonin GroES (HSP10)
MRVVPRNQYVLVEMDQVEETTAGGILRPDSLIQQEKAQNSRGTVLAVGPGRPVAEWEPTGNQFAARCCIEKMVGEGDNRKQVNLEVGDRVILRQSILQAYTKVDREQNTVLVDEADILAVVEE